MISAAVAFLSSSLGRPGRSPRFRRPASMSAALSRRPSSSRTKCLSACYLLLSCTDPALAGTVLSSHRHLYLHLGFPILTRSCPSLVNMPLTRGILVERKVVTRPGQRYKHCMSSTASMTAVHFKAFPQGVCKLFKAKLMARADPCAGPRRVPGDVIRVPG